jgi:HAD superfamily hydrolase (TIGR01509 family)
MSRVRGVLLDVDGTLIASNDAHAFAWVKALAEHGLRIPFKVIRKLIGMGGDKLLPNATGICEETPRGKAIAKRRKEIFLQEFLPTLYPTPGAEELLAELKKRGFKMVIATSATTEELAPLLRICRAGQFIEAQTSSDDADRSKPDPDIVSAALQNLALTPNHAVMLGDTPYDVQAAQKAGVSIICFRCGGWSDRKLAGAVAVYDNPSQLLHELDRSALR